MPWYQMIAIALATRSLVICVSNTFGRGRPKLYSFTIFDITSRELNLMLLFKFVESILNFLMALLVPNS